MVGAEKLRVGIVGVSGYAGLELLRILLRHPAVELVYLAGNHQTDGPVGIEFPHLIDQTPLPIQQYDLATCIAVCDVVFVALPAGASGAIAAELWQQGKRVIDLSGDLRLPADLYEQWYQKPALSTDVLNHSVYGLTEWNRAEIVDATLIANPGCYPTAILLALLPLFRANLVLQGTPILVDAKSGVSGAGRGTNPGTQFGALTENFYAYKVGRHQHTPEIEHYLGSNVSGKVVLTTHLLPIVRGIFATSYVSLETEMQTADVFSLYAAAYANAPFVRVLPPGQLPQVKFVCGANHCVIGLHVDERTNILQTFSVIDNLQKGASGQAVQNMNLMFGIPETTGIDALPFVP